MKRKEQGGKEGTGRSYLQILTFSFDLHLDNIARVISHTPYTHKLVHTQIKKYNL